MIEQVIFTNRRTAEARPGDPAWAVISISQPGDPAQLIDGWHSVHRVEFHDADPDRTTTRKRKEARVVMDAQQAKQIIKFVKDVAPEVVGIMVHCQGGISRSAAVAKWIAERYQLPFDHSYALHNQHVYKLLNEAQMGKLCSRK